MPRSRRDKKLYYTQLGQKVRLVREEAGLSQEELGHRLGCSGVTISSWETGKRRVSLEDLHSLARVLGKPLAFFFPDGSLSLNVENQIGDLLQRSIGDFLGTKQIPLYRVEPQQDGIPSPRVALARHMSVAAHLQVDFGLIIPDNHLAAIGIGAEDIAVCRHYDGKPPHEDCLMLRLEDNSFNLRLAAAGEEVAGASEAVCGILVFTIKHAQDILAALKALLKSVEPRKSSQA